MKREILVKHMHRYTFEQAVLYEGVAEYNAYPDYVELVFYEDQNTRVVMHCFEKYMEIRRFGEVKSHLTLKPKERTHNPMESIYGTFEVEMFTDAYLREDAYIMVAYDVENGTEDKDGFRIDIELKEDGYELN